MAKFHINDRVFLNTDNLFLKAYFNSMGGLYIIDIVDPMQALPNREEINKSGQTMYIVETRPGTTRYHFLESDLIK